MRKRPIKISLRLNEQEHEHLKQQAMLSGFPMEVFLRALISGMNLRSRPLAEYAEIRRQLAGIGNNINQIAHVVNTRALPRRKTLPQSRQHSGWSGRSQSGFEIAYSKIYAVWTRPTTKSRARSLLSQAARPFLLYRSIPASGTQASKYCLWIQRFMV